VAERIRKSIEDETFEEPAINLHITASVGVSLCGEDVESVRDLIMKADRALYKAKQQGKNQVVIG
jgi:diguanylate cyclase (GGDEF)-like protein